MMMIGGGGVEGIQVKIKMKLKAVKCVEMCKRKKYKAQ